jgi:hypothetical protein
VVVTSCSSSFKSSRPPGTATTIALQNETVCIARTNLKRSVATLASPSLLIRGKSAIQPELDRAKADLGTISNSARTVYRPQIDEVRSAITDLEAVLSKPSGSKTQNMQEVGTTVTEIGSYTALLITTLLAECPSS